MSNRLPDLNFYEFYQRYARIYNFYFGWMMNPGRVAAIKAASLKPGESVLEVGVGTGLSLALYPKEVKVTGIDLSTEMLKQARALVAEHSLDQVQGLLEMNAESLNFEDASFDCIMAMHVFTVVADPGKVARELKRVCKPGGRIILVSYFHEPDKLIGKVSKAILPYVRLLGWRADLTLADFKRVTGFEVERIIPVNLLNLHNVLIVKN